MKTIVEYQDFFTATGTRILSKIESILVPDKLKLDLEIKPLNEDSSILGMEMTTIDMIGVTKLSSGVLNKSELRELIEQLNTIYTALDSQTVINK